jgi:hypothetical protein
MNVYHITVTDPPTDERPVAVVRATWIEYLETEQEARDAAMFTVRTERPHYGDPARVQIVVRKLNEWA